MKEILDTRRVFLQNVQLRAGEDCALGTPQRSL